MRKRKADLRSTVIAGVAIAFGWRATAHAQQYPYAILDLGSPADCDSRISYGKGLNALGQVAGQACGIPGQAMVYFNGQKTYLEVVWGLLDTTTDMNDAGVVVGGAYSDLSFPYQSDAVVWINGQATVLPNLGGGAHGATGINESGVICGGSEDAEGVRHVVLWIDGEVVDLGYLPGTDGSNSAQDINEADEVVGYTTIDQDAYGFVWRDNVMSILPEPVGGDGSAAYAINDRGLAGGLVDPGVSTPGHAAIWDLDAWSFLDLNVGSSFLQQRHLRAQQRRPGSGVRILGRQ